MKLAVDQAVLGEATSHTEVEEYLVEYDSDWYIGSEADPEWTDAVTSGIGQLFSLSHDPIQVRLAHTYISHVISYVSHTALCRDPSTRHLDG